MYGGERSWWHLCIWSIQQALAMVSGADLSHDYEQAPDKEGMREKERDSESVIQLRNVFWGTAYFCCAVRKALTMRRGVPGTSES